MQIGTGRPTADRTCVSTRHFWHDSAPALPQWQRPCGNRRSWL